MLLESSCSQRLLILRLLQPGIAKGNFIITWKELLRRGNRHGLNQSWDTLESLNSVASEISLLNSPSEANTYFLFKLLLTSYS